MVRTQAMITQLVFDHALRIRVKAETSGSPPNSAHTSAATTPDTASIAEQSDRASSPGGSTDNSDNETSAAVSEPGSVGVKKTNQRDSQLSTSSTSTKVAEKPSESSSKGGNLVGKMTNLVTTDLNNIIDGRDFLFAGKSIISCRWESDYNPIIICHSFVHSRTDDFLCCFPLWHPRLEVRPFLLWFHTHSKYVSIAPGSVLVSQFSCSLSLV